MDEERTDLASTSGAGCRLNSLYRTKTKTVQLPPLVTTEYLMYDSSSLSFQQRRAAQGFLLSQLSIFFSGPRKFDLILWKRKDEEHWEQFFVTSVGPRKLGMEASLGLLRITVVRGVNLAIRDGLTRSSDPYVVVKLGKHRLRTKAVEKSLNPVWNEELTLGINDPHLPIQLEVYDKDFLRDDKMGDAEFDIGMLVEALRKRLWNTPTGTVIAKVQPNKENCLAEESSIVWEDGQIVQRLFLRLRDVECGEVELRLRWISVPGSRGL